MIELPEALVLAKQCGECFSGLKITEVQTGASAHKFAFFNEEAGDYDAFLRGGRISGAQAYAGYVEILIDEKRLAFNDGVNLRYFEPGKAPPDRHQLRVAFDNGANLICTVSMYGGLWAFYAEENPNPYYLAAKAKPSPYSEGFTPGYFLSLFEDKELKPSASVKAFLATNQRIPGLGNGVLQDILFHAKLHPKAKISAISAEQKELLYDALMRTLCEMAQYGGRDTESDLFGNPGGYRTILSKNTLRNPCPVCAGPLVRQAYLGGNVYFCENCQKI